MSVEEEQADINTEVDFVKNKVDSFNENVISEAILPEVDERLNEIRKLQDSLVFKWLKHKAKNKAHPGIADLEKRVTDLCEFAINNNKKVREKVSALISTHNSSQSTSKPEQSNSKFDFQVISVIYMIPDTFVSENNMRIYLSGQ